MSNDKKLVKDYLGNLIPKNKARKILGKFYEEDVSCFLMEDGQWYRKTSTEKICFDHTKQKYVLKGNGNLFYGFVDVNEEGYFSDSIDVVHGKQGKGKSETGSKWAQSCSFLNEEVAIKNGFIESIYDGKFYRSSEINQLDRAQWFDKKNIPNSERSKSYNLESDPDAKSNLIKNYENLNIKPSANSVMIGRIVDGLTFGMEAEVINGFIPKRIREKLGIKALKDGSLRHNDGEGIEFVTIPMSGAKGVEVIKLFCQELSKRCEVNNYCSIHFHFGNVRRDKLYVLSLYKIILLIQNELQTYFPYSRFNSIKEDGKVYCKKLDPLNLDYTRLLKCTDEKEFHKLVVNEFNKIYSWLNNGKPLAEEFDDPKIVREVKFVDGKKMFVEKWYRYLYTTKSVNHAINGEKWNKVQRYSIVNFLNLFFNNIHTIEFRPHEGSTNPTKVLNWFVICACILKYAENVKDVFETQKLTLKDILSDNLTEKHALYLMDYMNHRKDTFYNPDGSYKNYKTTEASWFKNDSKFEFKNENQLIKNG